MPLQWLAIEPPQQKEHQVSEVGPLPEEEKEAEVMPPLEAHIIRQIWMRHLMTLHYHLHDGQGHLLLPMQAPLIPTIGRKEKKGRTGKPLNDLPACQTVGHTCSRRRA